MTKRLVVFGLAAATLGFALGWVYRGAPDPASRAGGDAGASPRGERPAPTIEPRRAAPATTPPRIPRPARPALETAPLAADYDPTVLLPMNHSAAELFANEPRNPDWARPVEGARYAQVVADLAVTQPGAKVRSIECRTAICELVIEAPEAISTSTYFALQALGRADVHELAHVGPLEDGGQEVVIYGVYSAERPSGPSDADYERRRRAMLNNAREGAAAGAEPLTLPEQ